MFFLLRMAFWFSLVLLALPFNSGTDQAGGESVGAIQALAAASQAVGDISGLCERQPEVCEVGRSALHTVTVRAIETAKMAAGMLEDAPASDETDLATTTGSVPTRKPVN